MSRIHYAGLGHWLEADISRRMMAVTGREVRYRGQLESRDPAALVREISPPPADASPIQQDASTEDDVRALRDGSASLPRLIRAHLSEKSGAGTDRLMLYVDQWEELYTQTRRAGDEKKRAQKQADVARFIDLLLQATEDSPLTLVFTVRADFYDHLLQHDRLATIAQDQQISLGP